MITPEWQEDLVIAESYFAEHIDVTRYYGAGALFPGEWLGKGAAKLGLNGTVDEIGFKRLCRNQHPRTGDRLTQRHKKDRRIFCDFVLSPPKSVSVLALVGKDDRLVDLHRYAARIAADELEKLAMCRLRGKGQHGDIETANVVGARFTDPTSRELDPHLHDHLVLFNATWDSSSQSWKALQNSEMLRGQKFIESLYYHIYAQGLIQLGYEVRSIPGRDDFEIAGLDDAIIKNFSKRHLKIQESARKLEQAKGGNIKDHAEMLAHHQREPKQKGITREQLLKRWNGELTTKQKDQIDSLVLRTKCVRLESLTKASPSVAVSWALQHVLERRAVVRDHEILRRALEYARGTNVALDQLRTAFSERSDVLHAGRAITTAEVLQTETTLLEMAEERKGTFPPLNPSWPVESTLNREQNAALHGILNQAHEHVVLRGAAGTGKSTLLKKVCDAVEAAGRPLVVLAPQAQQARDLAADGLPSPQTLASALKADRLPENAVVIADEAGQIGSESLLKLFHLVRKHSCRLVLSGDTRQHGPVERGDALRSLEKYAKVEAFSLDQNQRQNPAKARTTTEAKQIEIYRQSVQAVAQGDVPGSLHLLDQMNGIREITGDRLNAMAQEYLVLARQGDSILAVSQTRAEVSQLNYAIREALQKEERIGVDKWEATALIARDCTEAEKVDPRTYEDRPMIVLHANALNWKAGKVLEVVKTEDTGIVVRTQRSEYLVPWAESTKWQVCRPQPFKLAKGERLQLKRNQRAVKDKDALVNGEIVEVSHMLKDGTIRLKDGRSLPPEYRTFQLGYACTSYGGQGKTVDHVLVSDSGMKAATNARQWYVDVSRGRRSATLFTSDKAGLMERICRHGDSPLALEVFGPKKTETPRAGLRSREILRQQAIEAEHQAALVRRRERVRAAHQVLTEKVKAPSLEPTDQERTRTR